MNSTCDPVAGILRALDDNATVILMLSNVKFATNWKTLAARRARNLGNSNLETSWESDNQIVATAELLANETRELMPCSPNPVP